MRFSSTHMRHPGTSFADLKIWQSGKELPDMNGVALWSAKIVPQAKRSDGGRRVRRDHARTAYPAVRNLSLPRVLSTNCPSKLLTPPRAGCPSMKHDDRPGQSGRHGNGSKQLHGAGRDGDLLGPHVDDLTALTYSEDGRLLLSCSSDSSAKAWKAQSGGNPATLTSTLLHPGPVSCISCSPIETGWKSCKLATGGGDGLLRIWEFSLEERADADEPEVQNLECHQDVIWCCAFNPMNEKQVATGSSDKTVKVWDITTGKCVATYEGHFSWVTSVSYNHGATLLASASKDSSIRLWDATKPGREVMAIWGHNSWVSAAQFTPNSAYLFSCSHDKTIRQWDIAHGMEVARLHGHAGPVSALHISSDGNMMATTSWDGTCRLWSLRLRKLLCVLPLADAQPRTEGVLGIAAVRGHCVSISPHGHICVGGTGGILRDFFAPPSLTKTLVDPALDRTVPRGKNKDVAPVGWVVDMILELYQRDSSIDEYIELHCGSFKMEDKVGKATQEQHDIHRGYVDKVLNFMEQVCHDLNIEHDDFERAMHVLTRREDGEAEDLWQLMHAVEDFSLFFSLMSLKRIERQQEVRDEEGYVSSEPSDCDSCEEEEADLPPLVRSRGPNRRRTDAAAGETPAMRASKAAVQGLLEEHHMARKSGRTKFAQIAGMRASQAQWERHSVENPDGGDGGAWEQVANQIMKEKAEVEATAMKQQQQINDLLRRVADSEKKRAALHEKVQELRGNIRVFCRVRPMLSSESGVPAAFSYDSTGDRPALGVSVMVGNRVSQLQFEFDKVFRNETTQHDVYKEVEPLMQSVMDGYKVCIFAYGQTGSGKTYTMEGSINDKRISDDDDRGVVPRCVRKLLQMRDEYKRTGDWDIRLTASAVEIYNETIRDLLTDDGGQKHEIRTEQETGETYVSGATVVKVATEKEIYNVIRVQSTNNKTGESMMGIMNMVDLAGSERVTDDHDELRLKEAAHINKSLSCLLGVILAIATKKTHVPFRNTKLTHLLKSSLVGHGKAIMFANVSPRAEHVNETVNTLRFATQVSSVQLGTGKHAAHPLGETKPK